MTVARVMWQAEPSLTEGVECWITAGGAHHTVLSYDVTAEQMRDWAKMMDIEFVHITKDATVDALEKELFLNNLAWKLKQVGRADSQCVQGAVRFRYCPSLLGIVSRDIRRMNDA